MITSNYPPSRNFVAIDIEYADASEQNICQIGVAVVHDLEIVHQASWLIQPPDNHYDEHLIRIHHITPEDTANMPTFPEVWPEIQPYMLMGELWAHNAGSVEQAVLEKNLCMYGFNADFLSIRDSRDLYQRQDCPGSGNGLEQCCMALGIPCENHHDARSDAEMCAKIIIAYQQGKKPVWDGVPKNNEELQKMTQEKRILHIGEFCDFYNGDPIDGIDVLAELTSTYAGAEPQVVDVFDKGDRLKKGAGEQINFSRIDVSPENPLREKRVVVTGLFRFDRELVAHAVEAMGAKLVSSPARNTDAVIIGTHNIGPNKLCALEKQEAKGHHIALIVGDDDLEALLYGDGHKFFQQQ